LYRNVFLFFDYNFFFFFFFQAEDGIRDDLVTGVQTCALPIYAVVWWWTPARRGPRLAGADDVRRGCARRHQRPGRAGASPSKTRSEERRVGKECRSRWARYESKKKKKESTKRDDYRSRQGQKY